MDADQIKMGKIEFYLSDDANNMVANFKNGTRQLIDDVPTNEMASLKAEYPDEYIVAGQVPASSFVAMGMTNPDGTQFY